MLIQLYAKKVITKRDKEMIETSRLQSDKMVYFLDSIIIPSLENNVAVKFKGFLEVMVESDDLLLIDMAKKLGAYVHNLLWYFLVRMYHSVKTVINFYLCYRHCSSDNMSSSSRYSNSMWL